jgi:ABC-type transport system involved in Fe-S cluster assembly fused permease/ATPase subunit
MTSETVKYFNNEEFELGRYEKAVVSYQAANYTTQTR